MKIIFLLQGSKLRNGHASPRYQSDPIYIQYMTYIHTYNTVHTVHTDTILAYAVSKPLP